jgi:hypothetical protein
MHLSKSKVSHPKMTVKKLPDVPEAADPAATEEETTDKHLRVLITFARQQK